MAREISDDDDENWTFNTIDYYSSDWRLQIVPSHYLALIDAANDEAEDPVD